MSQKKIEIKRIADSSARQLTFSKRRRGLFKKARELSILCEADVALVVSSSNGKLYDYSSSSSMKDKWNKYMILDKCILYPNTIQKVGQQTLEIKSEDLKGMKQPCQDYTNVREDLAALSLKDLQQLEEELEIGLEHIRSHKVEQLAKEINELQEKGRQMIEENTELRLQLKEASGRHVENNDGCGKSGSPVI